MKNIFIYMLFSGIVFLSACSEVELVSHVAKKITGPSTSESRGYFKVGSPYKILGKWYRPKESYTLVETGIASWYGPNFHGKPTANGERFDQYELTAAHRTLQMPSLVRVTNLENGRSLVVRVNDRGPFAKGRIIDLSKKSAELLGFKKQGTAKVRVEVLGDESRAIAEAAKRGEDTSNVEVAMNERPSSKPVRLEKADRPVEEINTKVSGHSVDGRFYPDPIVKTIAVKPSSIFVQVASVSDQSRAHELAQSLSPFGRAKVYPAIVNGKQFFRVRFPSSDVATADRILSSLHNSGRSDAIIVVE